MILIKNRIRAIPVNTKKLKADAKKLLDLLEYGDFDLGILLTSNRTIRTYNKKYRNKDKPTDILSFPNYPKLKAGQRTKTKNSDEKNLGDLIISLEYVKKDAERLGTTFEKRMQRILVHGICHLLGYDHIKDADYQVMLKKELDLLKHIAY